MRSPDGAGVHLEDRTATRRTTYAALIAVILAVSGFGTSNAQIQAGAGDQVPATVRVFLDCQVRNCPREFFQTEITFVDWVRDRFDASLYVLLTSEGSGGGGQAYTFDFVGQGIFEGRSDTLTYVSESNETQDQTREGLLRVFKLGLVPYLMRTRAGEQLAVEHFEEGVSGIEQLPAEDPWNYWVFSTRLNGDIEGEESRRENGIDASFSARRVTPDWKISIFANGNYGEDFFELSGGRTITEHSHRTNGNLTIVKSLGTHWSAGIRNSISSSSNQNQELRMRMAPAIEFSLYPYSEFTRRQFTVQYSLGGNYFDYYEQTIFNKWAEERYDHSLVFQYEVTQPWGSARTSLEASHYLEDLNQYNIELNTNWDIRLFRGFSLNINMDGSRIRDQLYIPKGDASDEEVLLEIRELQTGYDYSIRIGFSFTFGSIYNTVVNPRLDEPRRFGGGGRF